MKLLGSVMELARIAEQQDRLPVQRVHDATQVYVLFTHAIERAYILAIRSHAHNSEAAAFIWSIGLANVQVARAIRILDDVVDMGIQADFLARVLACFFRRVAWAAAGEACSCHEQGTEDKDKRKLEGEQ